jgi:hypothetical protein
VLVRVVEVRPANGVTTAQAEEAAAVGCLALRQRWKTDGIVGHGWASGDWVPFRGRGGGVGLASRKWWERRGGDEHMVFGRDCDGAGWV